MILDCAGVSTHLGHCTNIHADGAWQGAMPRLQMELPRVRARLCRSGPMGIGLRLSRHSLDALDEPQALADFSAWLRENDHYVFTLNGSTHGAFHGDRIKEDAYKPDWTEAARLEYTCRLASLLCKLGPPDDFGTINILPGTFRDWLMPGSEQRICNNLVRAVAHCVQLQRQHGVTIALALEPEPCCMLETVTETVDYFRRFLFGKAATAALAHLIRASTAQAEQAMQRHLGVCYDVAHSAVTFENPAHVIARLQSAGIGIKKVQLGSALDIPQVNESSLRQLARYDEPVYLHQVMARQGRQISRYNDLPAATIACRYRLESRSALDPALYIGRQPGQTPLPTLRLPAFCEPGMHWRVLYPVPVHLQRTEHFLTTQRELAQVLTLQRLGGFCGHLELQTHALGVLPEAQREQPLSRTIADELAWVGERLHRG